MSVCKFMSWWDLRLPLLPATLIDMEGGTPSRLTALSLIILRYSIIQLSVLQFYSEENLWLANVSSLAEYLSLPSQSSLSFFLWDNLMTGFALPKLPHVEFIGGITAEPAMELKGELRNWADAATDGFVVCSFGSVLKSFTDAMLQKLFQVFYELQPLPVIFKLSCEQLPEKLVSHVPTNVLMMDWLPQNDLLGHQNARLFITHAGTNGYGEALYHGVPLIAFPLIVIQRYMASRIEALGYGKEADLFTLNDTHMAAIVKQVLVDTRYRQRMGKISKIIKSRKHPGEVDADAAEHVIEFGDDHLRPHGSISLNIIEFYMLDILFLLS